MFKPKERIKEACERIALPLKKKNLNLVTMFFILINLNFYI